MDTVAQKLTTQSHVMIETTIRVLRGEENLRREVVRSVAIHWGARDRARRSSQCLKDEAPILPRVWPFKEFSDWRIGFQQANFDNHQAIPVMVPHHNS